MINFKKKYREKLKYVYGRRMTNEFVFEWKKI
jgi:hypothetical protein